MQLASAYSPSELNTSAAIAAIYGASYRPQLDALRAFYDARSGPTEPFYFYDPYDTNPRFSYDPTGLVTVGRYTVRFEGDWNQLTALGRSELNITLVEVA